MTTERLTTAVQLHRANAASINTLRDQIAPDATDAELAYFGQVCARLELDPFAGDMVLIGRWDKRLQRNVHRPQLTIAGRRNIAERTGLYDGMDGPEWCGPRDKHGDLVWREVWDDDDNYPYAARVLVYRKDRAHPANGTCKWSEFSQTDKNEHLLPLWEQMPSHMIAKAAESLALRRGFAQVAAAVAIVGDDDDADVAGPATTEPRLPAASSSVAAGPQSWPEPKADIRAINSLRAKLELLRAADGGAWEDIRGRYKMELGCPALTGDEQKYVTRAHAELLRLMIEHPYADRTVLPSASDPGKGADADGVPDDVYDDLPESEGIDVDPSERYDPTDGTGQPFT